MAVPSRPTILRPNNGISFSTNISLQSLSGETSLDTVEILFRRDGAPLTTSGVEYTAGDVLWSIPALSLNSGANLFEIVARNADGDSFPAILAIELLALEDLNAVVTSPTGVTVRQRSDGLDIRWVENPEDVVIGYKVYYSFDPGGGTLGYQSAHSGLIDEVFEILETSDVVSDESVVVGSVTERTIVTEDIERSGYRFLFTELPETGGPIPIRNVFFVITALAYDAKLQEVVESVYSMEVFGFPLEIDASIRDLEPRTQDAILQNFVERWLTHQEKLDIKPGEPYRDIHIDPPVDEFRRANIYLDAINRFQSILTLVAFDDPNLDGVSDSVVPGTPKFDLAEALGIDADTVQAMVDFQFDKLGKNVEVVRQGDQQARGFVTFFTPVRPESDVVVPRGSVVSTTASAEDQTVSVSFSTRSDAAIRVAFLDAFYNPEKKRYEVTVPIVAITAGEIGNQPSGAIDRVSSGVPTELRVENQTATQFGVGEESNRRFAERILIKMVGIDTGTVNGYTRTAIAIPGVLRFRTVDAGDPFMFRDFDPIRLFHAGGKVDGYVVGSVLSQKIDTLAFFYPTVFGSLASLVTPIVDVPLLRFRVVDSGIGVDQPIFEILRVVNITRGNLEYSLDNMVIENGATVDLDETNALNITIGLDSTDEIRIDYRYRPRLSHKFSSQPLSRVVSVTGGLSGSLDENYHVFKTYDPLKYGESLFAEDSIEVFFDSSNGLPLDTKHTVSGEEAVLTGQRKVRLSLVGVLEGSISVTNADASEVFIEGIDYVIVLGDSETPTTIRRTGIGSNIADGEEVLVSYEAGENIQIKYLVNDLVRQVQREWSTTAFDADDVASSVLPTTPPEGFAHNTADAITKNANQVRIDIALTAYIRPGFTPEAVRLQIATAVSLFINNLGLGVGAPESSVIEAAESVRAVSQIGDPQRPVGQSPLDQLARSDGSLVLREDIGNDFVLHDIDVVKTYITAASVLDHPTIDGGGFAVQIGTGNGRLYGPVQVVQDRWRGFEAVATELEVGRGSGRCFVRGDGRVIISPFFKRVCESPPSALTAEQEDPLEHNYAVTYKVFNEDGVRDIVVASLDYVRIGELVIDVVPQESRNPQVTQSGGLNP